MIPAYPKIFTLGDRFTKEIFDNSVQVTEKVDGSQFAFGKINGTMHYRSKGAAIYVDAGVQELFNPVVNYIESIQHIIPEGIFYYGETLASPRHNTLSYTKIPKNHLALFAAMYQDGSIMEGEVVKAHAVLFDVDHVPILFTGKVEDGFVLVKKLLDTESYLGGVPIEGVVFKNFSKPIMIGNQVLPLSQAKFVSEKFKEVHVKEWTGENTVRGKWDNYKAGFKTEARWMKSIQHMQEDGKLTDSPKDIGGLLKAIKDDIVTEEKENIKEFLWHEFGQELLRVAIAGFPEFYKEYLLKSIERK